MKEAIDNFEKIKRILRFESEDDFYFVQIIQRKKDNPGGINGSNNSSRLIKAYYISSIDKLMKLKDEMIFFADYFNARVGINLNKRSYYKTAFNTMKHMAEQMHNKNFKNVRRAYNSACGIHNANEDKVWLLDIDDIGRGANEIIRFIERECQPIGEKYITVIPSKNGYHLITKPFDTREFKIKFTDIEIHKNNPTNLYIPRET